MDEKEPAVFVTIGPRKCSECETLIGMSSIYALTDAKPQAEPICLDCADLGELILLPAGDTALTGRARRLSGISRVVLKWSQNRKRYERQGVLVEEAALAAAEAACLADADARARQRERASVRREQLDATYVEAFAEAIRRHFPGCPPGVERTIAEHACRKSSGRVGRTAAAKEFAAQPVRLAVIAHIRHTQTNYDRLFGHGFTRDQARAQVHDQVMMLLASWQCR